MERERRKSKQRRQQGGREERRGAEEKRKETPREYLDDRRVNGMLYLLVIIRHRLVPNHHDTLAGEGVEEGGLRLHTEGLPGPFHQLLVSHRNSSCLQQTTSAFLTKTRTEKIESGHFVSNKHRSTPRLSL